jgi:hypothetical protein
MQLLRLVTFNNPRIDGLTDYVASGVTVAVDNYGWPVLGTMLVLLPVLGTLWISLSTECELFDVDVECITGLQRFVRSLWTKQSS